NSISRTVDHHVNAPALFIDLPYALLDGFIIGHIHAQRVERACVAWRQAAACSVDGHSPARKVLGAGPADPRRRAGDQHYFGSRVFTGALILLGHVCSLGGTWQALIRSVLSLGFCRGDAV